MRIVWVLLVCTLTLTAQTESYIGAAACGQCHPDQFRQQSASEHAHSLSRATEHPLAASFVPRAPLRRSPNYEFRFALERRGFLVRIATAENGIVLPIEWAFGSGDQAVTFVSRLESNSYLEHYFSYYAQTHAMGITPGQEVVHARGLAEAAGHQRQALDVAECFYCHSTGPVRISGGDVQPNEIGVRCEVCHGPGSLHQQMRGKGSIRNPRRIAASELNDVCGKCHRLPVSTNAKFDWDDPWNLRFEPAYLARSACFLKSGGKLSCLTCHDAHAPLKRDASSYNNVCASCHASAHAGTRRENCIACHMPRVSPRESLWFTDHRIGIRQPARALLRRYTSEPTATGGSR